MKDLIKFIVQENVKEGYSVKEQIVDGIGMILVVIAVMVFAL